MGGYGVFYCSFGTHHFSCSGVRDILGEELVGKVRRRKRGRGCSRASYGFMGTREYLVSLSDWRARRGGGDRWAMNYGTTEFVLVSTTATATVSGSTANEKMTEVRTRRHSCPAEC